MRVQYSRRFEQAWQQWPNKSCKYESFKVWQKFKLDTDEDLFKEVMTGLEIEVRHKRAKEKAGDKVLWCHFRTWLNQRRFLDEIDESFGSLKERAESKLCQCGAETLGPKFKYCSKCYPEATYAQAKVAEREREIRAYAESRGISAKPGSVEWSKLLLSIRKKHGFTL